MKIDTASIVEIPSNVVSKKVDDDVVVLNIKDGTYFKLNETGTIVWDQLAQGASIEEAIGQILKSYNSSYEVAKKDVVSLVASLQDEGLLKIT